MSRRAPPENHREDLDSVEHRALPSAAVSPAEKQERRGRTGNGSASAGTVEGAEQLGFLTARAGCRTTRPRPGATLKTALSSGRGRCACPGVVEDPTCKHPSDARTRHGISKWEAAREQRRGTWPKLGCLGIEVHLTPTRRPRHRGSQWSWEKPQHLSARPVAPGNSERTLSVRAHL